MHTRTSHPPTPTHRRTQARTITHKHTYTHIHTQPRTGAPAHWRTRKIQGCGGAFEGLCIALLGSPPGPLDEDSLALIVQAGGGTCLRLKGMGAPHALQVCACARACVYVQMRVRMLMWLSEYGDNVM
jgi:hypothetical protein